MDQGNYNGNYNGNYERYRKPEKLINEELLSQVPSDPTAAEIVEILAKAPAAIAYIHNLIVEKQKQISMKKLLLKQEERQFEGLISKARMDVTTKYRQLLAERLEKEPGEVNELMKNYSYTKAEAKEIVKNKRPDKPTSGDIKDAAFLRSEYYHRNNIIPLEEEIKNLENDLNILKVKQNLFENNFKASQSIKGLLQDESWQNRSN